MPDHWKSTTLGEVADVVSGGTPRTNVPEFWSGDIVWVTPSEVVANEGRVIFDSERKITQQGLANSSAKMLPVDAVLLTSRATIGAVALAGVPLATNQGFASLVCGEQVVARLAMYWCQANTHELVARAGGNTFKEISRKKVSTIPLALPPLREQGRIVDVVGSIDDVVAALEAQIAATRRMRGGVLAEMLGTPGPDWTHTTLGEVADVEMGQSPPGHTYNDEGVGLPFLQGSAEFGERFPVPDRWCSVPTRIAEPGDLLVSVRAPVGDTNFAHTQIAFGRGLARVRSTADASADYLCLVIQSELARLNQRAGGGMFASITAKNLRDFPVQIPTLVEQGRIVEVVGAIDEQVTALEQQAAVTRTLRAGVLQELLSGKRLLDESYDLAMGL